MPYIGKSPVGGGFHKLDNLTASATDTYALTLGGAAYYPETANQLLCSLNGVIQAPQDSFTVSGSNLVFDSALTSSDSIDFVVALGDVLGVGSVTDGAITTAKIANGAVTAAKIDSLPTGSVLQVKAASDTAIRTSSSQTFDIASNTAQITITPSSSTSNFLITCTGVMSADDGNDGWFTSIFRDSTNLGNGSTGLAHGNSVANVSVNYFPFSMTILDSPATASDIVYGLRIRGYDIDGDGGTARLGQHVGGTSSPIPTHITVMEIAG
ncbi:hypothetical protein OAA57_01045 [bacterium]|jgi:hypothetical protein|nr:hypothetical protein [Candidatus Gracilibacteria bacterium]MDB4350149.1 hypothetical protein [bacterium]